MVSLHIHRAKIGWGNKTMEEYIFWLLNDARRIQKKKYARPNDAKRRQKRGMYVRRIQSHARFLRGRKPRRLRHMKMDCYELHFYLGCADRNAKTIDRRNSFVLAVFPCLRKCRMRFVRRASVAGPFLVQPQTLDDDSAWLYSRDCLA